MAEVTDPIAGLMRANGLPLIHLAFAFYFIYFNNHPDKMRGKLTCFDSEGILTIKESDLGQIICKWFHDVHFLMFLFLTVAKILRNFFPNNKLASFLEVITILGYTSLVIDAWVYRE